MNEPAGAEEPLQERAAQAPPQTALHGVALGSLLNLLSLVLAWLRQVVITASFGLVTGLDAFYVATSFVSIFVNSFGDLADAVGVPSLVRARRREGEGPFRGLAALLVRRALVLGALLTVLMLALSPFVPAIVPGFPTAGRNEIVHNLLLLAPYALLFLPYHVLGSVFRSVRAFHLYYCAELAINALALACLFAWRHTLEAVPLSFSFAYVGGFALLFVLWRRRLVAGRGVAPAREVTAVSAGAARMLPVYAVTNMLVLVDRLFASYLSEGSISALFYGYLLAFLVPGVMSVDRIFATSLAEEESDRSGLLTRIFSGSWLVALPVTVFTVLAAEELVSLLFERGEFGRSAVVATGSALRYYVLGLPVVFVWPTCIRVLQIASRYGSVLRLAIVSLVTNAVLDYLFVFHLDLGVGGIALATSVACGVLLPLMLRRLAEVGVRVRWREFRGALPGSLLGAAAAAALVLAPPLDSWPVLVRGTIFVLTYGIVAGFLARTREVDRLKEMIAFSFPALKPLLVGKKGSMR